MILTFMLNNFIEIWIQESEMIEDKLNSYVKSKDKEIDQELIDFQDSMLNSRLKAKIELSQK